MSGISTHGKLIEVASEIRHPLSPHENMIPIPKFTYSPPADAIDTRPESAPANVQADKQAQKIDEDLRKSSALTLNDIGRGRTRFGVMSQEHQKRGLSPVAAAGLAAVKSAVPMSVAKFVRSRSVSKTRQAETKQRIAADWNEEFKAAADATKRPVRDPYDTSDDALDKAVDQEEKRIKMSESRQLEK